MTDSHPHPIDLFHAWLAEAEAREPNDPNAMTLATASAEGAPSARMVLLKGADRAGFVFYSNLESRKGGQLRRNARVALLFHWKTLRRQVRVEGTAAPVADAEADAYFASRPRLSRLGAWASDQSQPLPDRATLEERLEAAKARFGAEEGDIPRPRHWSGFRVTPAWFEFWRDGAFRLHHRTAYEPDGAGGWRTGLLYP